MQLDFYSATAVFAVCCVAGYLVERGWCLLRKGRLESRKSLLYGPFSVAYGMGGLLLTAVLLRFEGAPGEKIFLAAFAAGTLVEYICSWGQELLFHSVAWDYSGLPLNIHGRVCLLYSLFWGVLGLAWVRFAFPLLYAVAPWLEMLWVRRLIWAFAIFFAADAALSACAALRMGEREKGVPARTAFGRMLDRRYPDERIRAVYANSRRVERKLQPD